MTAIIRRRGEAAIARTRRRLARRLDPATYEAAHQMHGCLKGLTAELYEDRYSGLGSPAPCCYQGVIDYEEATRG